MLRPVAAAPTASRPSRRAPVASIAGAAFGALAVALSLVAQLLG
ncbi:MAG: hypothetical protein ACK5QD_12570 [Brevundimonas sp.]|jgi:hypothetical protein|nr:hypothetical protein [Brevundimonas sp.]MCZ8195420.1 hypothetical protein [Brevundimonas sp.]